MLPALLIAGLSLMMTDAVPPQPPPGTLCVGVSRSELTSGKCSTVTGTSFDVAPADHARLFLWTDRAGRVAQLGIVPPKANTIDLQAKDVRELKLRVHGDPSRGWPLETKLTLVRGDDRWRWTIGPREIGRLELLRVPTGRYTIDVASEHHRQLSRTAVSVTAPVTDAGELALVPLPRVRGKTVDAERHAIPAATVSLPDATVCTTADEQGAFICELREPFPASLVVGSSGYGLREFALPHDPPADLDLGAIMLSRGVALELTVKRPAELGDIEAVLLHVGGAYEHARVATARLARADEKLRFTDLAKGDYLAVFDGSEPTERVAVPIAIGDEPVVKEVTIEPYRLNGSIKFGEQAVKGAIELMAPKNAWRTRVTLSDGGEFSVPMWQKGVLTGFIFSPDLGAAEIVHSPELGEDPSTWNIRIERREISGRIFDRDTSDPVGNVQMQVDCDLDDDTHARQRLNVGADGTYRIAAKPGVYRMKVDVPDYVAAMKQVRIAEDDRTRTVDFALERGVVQVLRIESAAGQPIPNAMLLEGVSPERINPEFIFSADAAGEFELRGHPNERRTLYVVPEGGSFAIVHAVMPASSAQSKPMRVAVPPPAGLLHVRTVTKSGSPVRAGLVVRFNGDYLPNAVLRFVNGNPIETAPNGEALLRSLPAGTYEVWATTGLDDMMALVGSGFTLRTPVTVGFSGGEVGVTVPIAR